MKFGRRIKVRHWSEGLPRSLRALHPHPCISPYSLQDSRYAEWADQYIAYGALKKQIKSNLPWTDTAEADFLQTLDGELEKCEKFQKDKSDELFRRIVSLEREVIGLVHRLDDEEGEGDDEDDDEDSHNHPHRDAERNAVHDDRHHDAGSDDDDDEDGDGDSDSGMSIDAVEERFRELEDEVAVLVADVHDLALFTKLNFTGFVKIVKKHDKLTGWSLKETFNKDYLENHPFYRMNYDHLIVKLSKLFDLVRTRGHPIEGDSSAGGNQNAFVRSTTKYWVHHENIVPLKLAIMKHLPVLGASSSLLDWFHPTYPSLRPKQGVHARRLGHHLDLL